MSRQKKPISPFPAVNKAYELIREGLMAIQLYINILTLEIIK
jgi:hypothetical protein